MNNQVLIKAKQIARMVIKGIPKTRIAIEMGMSYDGIMRITRCEEYKAIEFEVLNEKVLDKMDARLEKRAQMEDQVEDTVPEALQVLLDHVKQKRDLKAALEVLDRDPKRQFTKASRNAPPPDPQQAAADNGVLSAAVKEADITHNMVTTQQAKPAEA